MHLLKPFRTIRLAKGYALAAALLAFSMSATAGLLNGLIERTFEHQVTKHVGEHYGHATAAPVSLPPGGSFIGCQHLFPQGVGIDVAKVDVKLVYNEASAHSWAYIPPNTAEARVEAPMDYSSFVQQTG